MSESLRHTFFGAVGSDGKIVFDHRDRFAAHLHALTGERIVVTIAKAETQRTMSQNRYYWSCVVRLLSEHCGYEEGAMHAELKRHFGVESTKTMTLEEFGSYVDRVRIWARTEMGVELPDPSSVAP